MVYKCLFLVQNISIFLVKTTHEIASDELVPSLQFVKKLAQVSSVYRLRSVLICQKSPPSGHLDKKCQSKSRPTGPPD